MEKPNVNRVADKELTKDGIHMIIGIQMDHTLQLMLRDNILQQIGDILDLPLTNSWENVLDEGISKGSTNWQLYGSQKPGNEAYEVKYYLIAELTENNEWSIHKKSIKELDMLKDLPLLSAQYENHIQFDIHPDIKEEYEKKLQMKTNKIKKQKNKSEVIFLDDETEMNGDIQIEDITNHEILKKAVDNIMSKLRTTEQHIKEIHQYTQILPEKYYQPGSHDYNTEVGFALKHTDERLFLSWIMLRAKASDFDFNDIPRQYKRWKYDFSKRPDGLTKASIIYWARQDNYEEYEKVKSNTIDQYIENTIFEAGDWDYAMVLFQLFKDKYVCSSINNKKWYVFKKHRWVQDEGLRLRMAISKDLWDLYSAKQTQYLSVSQQFEAHEDNHEKAQRKIKKIAEICIKLKKTNDKNNIMREAMELFYDENFSKNIDSNPYLMCFTNGVFDFKEKKFRDGYPQDYITKTTGIPYIPNPHTNIEMVDEIKQFMKKLFPEEGLCKYMWDHLASVLIGIKKEHVFNIYKGSGSNGKSILTDLMSQCLGEYKGTVPITLVTDKRSSIGCATPEVMQLKGVRYAVMQEPSKDAVINEGIMKEMTGGDPLQGRALYCDSEIFIPQFSLVVCTNSLFEIKSNDDGTWRRMKVVNFLSKFVSEGENHTDDTKYIFPKDKSLKEKLPKWAPIFMAMLIERACETEGEVHDCNEVVEESNKYRQKQDAFSGFIIDKIVRVDGRTKHGISKTALNEKFKLWYSVNFGNNKVPKLSELTEIIDKKYGRREAKTDKWYTFIIKEDDYEADEMEELNCGG
jgi:P4 family phage/plasmid primase-like protien